MTTETETEIVTRAEREVFAPLSSGLFDPIPCGECGHLRQVLSVDEGGNAEVRACTNDHN